MTDLQTFEFTVVTVNDRGQEIDRQRRSAQFFTEDMGNGVVLEMVSIPGGSFMMGSPDGEDHDSEKPQHRVTVPEFFMGKYPVEATASRGTISAINKNVRALGYFAEITSVIIKNIVILKKNETRCRGNSRFAPTIRRSRLKIPISHAEADR